MNELDGFEISSRFFSAPLLNINYLIKDYQSLRTDMKDRDQNEQTIRGLKGTHNLEIHCEYRMYNH